jgi:hypothetical protein
MERARVVRGLLITMSAVCGIRCVLLVALWVRSYWKLDTLGIRIPNNGAASVTKAIDLGLWCSAAC